MSEIIRVPNFSAINLKESTYLDADASVGANQINVVNELTYVSGNKILVGGAALETAEVATIQSISGKVITLTSALKNKHLKGETVTVLLGDRIRLYRAANVDGSVPADNSFTYIDIFATIEGDDSSSDLPDPNGGSGYWYKTTYYSSVTADETALSYSIAVRGGGYGKLASIESIRTESGLLDNQLIPDSRFAERRDQSEAEVLAAIAAAGYTVPLGDYVPPLIENIVRLLSAGYMMMQEYPTVEGEANPGKAKVKEARDLLKRIQSQELVLFDMTGNPLSRTSQVSGWPDNTTELVGTDGTPEPFQMRMSKRF